MSKFIEKLFDLEDRVVAITGGGGHLCGEMARAFGEAGCKVAVLDIRPEKSETVAAQIRERGGSAVGLALDATSKSSFESALEAINREFGALDIAVNGAGTNSSTPFFEMELKEWHSVMDSQITSTFLGCQVFGRQMVAKRSGSIINISSASAGPPLSRAFPYSVAKAGIKNLTQNLGREWAKLGVRVNAIRPGFFPTDWNRKNFITAERETSILGHTPMGRYGEVSELIGAMIWLASDAAGFVTGAEIAVDGGFSAMTI
ncbi:SDR family oxidoreductase [Rhizobium sp. M1]|uniref:SDR family oxidoreductase n=1 Tax=Rhizobium sp. M1 TaxID=2035453 RepID=UPI001AECBF0A|nr:SDR family oxidoreductase [Rhizobium sp. M1]